MEGCKKYVHLGRGCSNRRFLNLGITKISMVYLSKAWFVALNIVKLTIRILLLWHSAHQKCRVTLHKEEREALAEPTDSHFLSFTNLPGLSCCIEYGMPALLFHGLSAEGAMAGVNDTQTPDDPSYIYVLDRFVFLRFCIFLNPLWFNVSQ